MKLLPKRQKEFGYRIDWRAFLVALVATPLIWMGVFVLILSVSIFPGNMLGAAIWAALGGVLYVLIGLPVLYLYYRRHLGDVPGAAWRGAVVAGGGSILAMIAVIIAARAMQSNFFRDLQANMFEILGAMSLDAGLAALSGFLWGGTFGAIYGRMRAPSTREPYLPQDELLERFD